LSVPDEPSKWPVEQYYIHACGWYQAVPPKKNFVRGISYFTGYYVVSTAEDKDQPGCQVTYITQSDPRGMITI